MTIIITRKQMARAYAIILYYKSLIKSQKRHSSLIILCKIILSYWDFSWEGFQPLIKGCFILLPNQCGTSQSTSLWGPAFLLVHRLVSTPLRGTARRLAHRPVSDSDTICNNPGPPLADIVLFGLFLSDFPSRL